MAIPWLEALAAAIGFGAVWLTVRQNPLCWPVGMVNVALYAWIFAESRLWASAVLQGIYLLLAAWGWAQWLHGGEGGQPLAVARASPALLGALLVGVLVLTPVLGTGLAQQGGMHPHLDAALALASLGAQFLQARKLLESWAAWIAIDLGYTAFYGALGLLATALLYLAWTGLAVAGWLSWRRDLDLLAQDRARTAAS